MVTPKSSIEHTEVLNTGSGKAALQLHLPSWRDLDYSIVAYDPNTDRLDPSKFAPDAKQMHDAGRLRTVTDLNQLDHSPTVVDVTSASGHHVDAIEAFLDAAKQGDFDSPKAWLIEKPVVSDFVEGNRLKALIESGDIVEDAVFVNENYNASRGLERVKRIIDIEQAAGNPLVGVDVSFNKDRVPDVLAGRFTDPTLGAFGIELPHQLAIAYNLADIDHDDHVAVKRNDYYKNVHDVAHSEGTYTELQTDGDIKIRLIQGLGPFVMQENGKTIAQDPGIARFAVARFADGSEAIVQFDPVPGAPRFNSAVEWKGKHILIPDNTVQRVIGSVAQYAAGSGREPYATGLSVRNAIRYAETLNDLRSSSDVH